MSQMRREVVDEPSRERTAMKSLSVAEKSDKRNIEEEQTCSDRIIDRVNSKEECKGKIATLIHTERVSMWLCLLAKSEKAGENLYTTKRVS